MMDSYAQCVNTEKISDWWFLLFDSFVYRQNVTCLKRFTNYSYYAGEVESIIVARLTKVVS